jgi:hypothetical protein
MPTQDDVRAIALSLPETTEGTDPFGFAVAGKAFAWLWNERIEPKRPRVPNPRVLAVRIAHEADKAVLIDMDPGAFFTEPHYNGFPAILVRLEAVDPDLLRTLIVDAWRCRAPRRLIAEFDRARSAGHGHEL